jgi:hypothetical protein
MKDLLIVKVTDLLLIPKYGFVMLLHGPDDPRTLRVFIGAAEAQAIMIFLSKTSVPRPLTHDLMKNFLDLMECRLIRVEIHRLVDNTFYGRLLLEHNGLELEVDSRPSDAVALAQRCGAPIGVARAVMDQAGVIMEEKKSKKTSVDSNATDRPADKPPLSPLEDANQQLERAIREERYEDAAHLRDEIQ